MPVSDPATHTVTDAAGLMAALRNAGTNDIIELAAGDYGQLTLKGQAGLDMDFAGGVTLRAADPGTAVITGLDLRGAANLTFEGIAFDYRPGVDDPDWLRPFAIRESQNITILGAVFDGHGNGYGLSVTGSAGITLAGSTLTGFVRGAIFSNSRDITITGNDIAQMRSDGLNFGGVQDVLIADNHIHDFNSPAGGDDHPDMIQIWTRGTDAPTTGVTITGNTLDIGDGTPAQSIFIRNDLVDRGLAGPEMFYRDITITDNVIVNAQSHGITVGETDGLVVANNTVLHADGGNDDGADASVEIPLIRVSEAAVNVQISQNITGGIAGVTGQDSWSVADNVTVQDQDPNADGYYGDVFLASSLTTTGAHDFRLIPDGMVAQSGAGASASYAGVSGADGTFLTAQFEVRPDAANAAARVFDAGASSSGGDITYHWDFGDGVTAVGAVVTHVYRDGGTYDAVLTVSDGHGAATSAVSMVDVAGPQVLGMTADGRFILYDLGQATVLEGMGQGDGGGLYLGDPGVTAQVDRAHLGGILNADEFAISFTLEGAASGAAGEVMRLHSSFLTQVTTSGEMVLYAWDTDGDMTKLKTAGAGISDGAVHDVAIRLADDVLVLTVDGVAVSAAFEETLANKGKLDLMFGNPWGKDNFAGTLRDFAVTVDASDYMIRAVLGAADSFDFAPPVITADSAWGPPVAETQDATPLSWATAQTPVPDPVPEPAPELMADDFVF